MDRDDAFREFVAARERSLMRSAYVLTGDRHLAEDLLQSALAKVASRWWRIRQVENAEAYARSVLYREFLSWRRVRRNREIPIDALPEPPGTDFTEGTVLRVALKQALAQLTSRQRAIVTLRFYEDRSVAETAELVGCSQGAVKSQTHDALIKLRALGPDLVDHLPDIEPTTSLGGSK
jgi:RNA polymerase sigma-70 factor (sigma-E family)